MKRDLFTCPCCGYSGQPLHWDCYQVCPLYPFRRDKLHLHVYCHLCQCEWSKFRNGVLLKVKVHFLTYKLHGMPETEAMEYDNEQTRDTIAGKVTGVFGPIIEGMKRWTEEREVGGSSSSEVAALEPSLSERIATMTDAQLRELQKLLDARAFGKSL